MPLEKPVTALVDARALDAANRLAAVQTRLTQPVSFATDEPLKHGWSEVIKPKTAPPNPDYMADWRFGEPLPKTPKPRGQWWHRSRQRPAA